MNYKTYTLPNGLRIIHLPSSSHVAYCGYQINAGSRNEEAGEDGLAHFCEHMTFKGTAKRSAWNILNCLESVGGDINAYTKKEETVFYAVVPQEYINRAIDLLTDIVFQSTYPQKEIDKEVEVICDEIESYNDSPADLIYDDFENILFKGHPLGHNILGTTDRVRGFTTKDAIAFTQKYYRPDNAVFFIYGGEDDTLKKGAAIPKLLQKAFAKYGAPTSAPHTKPLAKDNISLETSSPVIVREKNTHQAHVMLGSRAYNDDESQLMNRISLSLLNNIIGGPAMNSTLNIALREHKGLVYTVESLYVTYSDTGLWSVYFGCDEKDIKKCLKLIHRELSKFREKKISESKLNAAKRQLKGQIDIESDNHENFALDFGSYFLHENKTRNLDEIYSNIDAVTAERLQQVANEIFNPDKIVTLIYK